jgi:hypothetical protein
MQKFQEFQCETVVNRKLTQNGVRDDQHRQLFPTACALRRLQARNDLIVLPPIKSHIREVLLSLVDYKDIPTEQLKQMARHLPGGAGCISPTGSQRLRSFLARGSWS